MVKLTYAHLINQSFGLTLNKLCAISLPTRVSHNLLKIKKALGKHGAKAQEALALINCKHIKNDGQFLDMQLDEQGNKIPGKFVYKEGCSEDTQRADLVELFKIEFKINAFPLKLEDLSTTRQGTEIELSADDLLALEPILEITEDTDLEDFVEEALAPKDLLTATESDTKLSLD